MKKVHVRTLLEVKMLENLGFSDRLSCKMTLFKNDFQKKRMHIFWHIEFKCFKEQIHIPYQIFQSRLKSAHQ